MAAQPIKVIRVGGVQLSIWENEVDKGTIKTASISKSYKDKSGKWATTANFKGQDLPLVSLAIQKALEFLYVKDSGDKTSEPQTEDTSSKI